MDQPHEFMANLGEATAWHLKLCLYMCEVMGAHSAAARLSSAIDAFQDDAAEEEIASDTDLSREEHLRMVLEMFDKHGKT